MTIADIREKKRVAGSSVLAAIAITGLKLFVGLETNSLGILSEAAHSGLDLLAAAITYFAVSISDRPPDRDHQYGHGKVENVSAFIETLLLVATCAWIIYEAVGRILGAEAHIIANVWGYAVISLSIIVDLSRSRALRRAAKRFHSQALEADALHFSSDIWSSLVVLAGLVMVNLGYVMFDAIAAIIVALLVLLVTYRLGKRTIDALMDRVPEGVYEEVARSVQGISGVAEIKRLRVRASGPKLFVDATVGLPRTMPFQQAHDIMDAIEQAILSRRSSADVVVHAEPIAGIDETVAQKVQMITLRRGLGTPHNLEVHRRNEKYFIDFDIEVARGKGLVDAHDIASDIEATITREIADVEKVTIHMEEVPAGESVIPPDEEITKQLRDAIGACILSGGRVMRYSGLTLLKVGDKYNLSVECIFEKSRTLDETHQVISTLESLLYKQFPSLRRVTIHAEPD